MIETFLPTVVLRHRKENLKKCSLRGLETRPDFRFYTYPTQTLPPLQNYFQLSFDGPLLTKEDAHMGLFLIDATWLKAKKMAKTIDLPKRSLPGNIRTAYPRYQTDCDKPERGLASIEAIFIAYQILGRSTEGLLDTYLWKEDFLAQTEGLDGGVSSCRKTPR